MPISHVSNSYQPEQLKKLTEPFNLVWPQIMLDYGAATDIQLEALRTRLACACLGEFEPGRSYLSRPATVNGRGIVTIVPALELAS